MARVEVERDGAVLTIVNNDPATRNSLVPEVYLGTTDALKAAEADASVRAVVLTGAGDFFCSGGNITSLRDRVGADTATRRQSVEKLHTLIRTIRASRLPIIAAVEGGAAGAGASLAAACDLIVASRTAYMSIAYVKIGLTPDGGSTVFFGRALPRHLVQEMVWTGDRIPAERLAALGLINRLAEPGTVLAAAQAWAAELARGPAMAIARGKALVNSAATASVDEQLDLEADGIAEALGGPEAREGLAAFLDKRPTDFTKT
ncbi:oxepin-CoA hydrolase, alternative type [Acuticoccus sp. I52.16.1]|uniref:oxepin-CoA hydrolase, alternative type n=1 Tax=Acuticoccus sp. I52.16.1 TaxID=2928472 RepID=UPI001FD1F844|nr:enoyl-CoA hydratase family protein [Acuticoccus sp. I52.16.1]UOM33223.1 enoyl-CoA hydratase family protein [Acuticoccus sp. I52.16.1]